MSFGDNLKKLTKIRVSVEKLEEKKKIILSIALKRLYFYVFWLAESKFLMEKEVWQASFGDNLKKLSIIRVSVEKLEKKKEHCFPHIKITLFYVFWLAVSKFVMEKEDWQPSFGDNLKKLLKSRVSVEKLAKKKKHCFHHIKIKLYFYVFWLAESKLFYGKSGLTYEFRR